MKSLRPLLLQGLLTLAVGMSSTGAQAGNHQYEPLAASVQAAQSMTISGIISIVPIIIGFAIVQRALVSGLMAGGVKG